MCHLQISFPILLVSFSFVDCFLCCAEAFYLHKVPIVFAFNSLAFGDVSSKKLLWLRSERSFPALSSRVLWFPVSHSGPLYVLSLFFE